MYLTVPMTLVQIQHLLLLISQRTPTTVSPGGVVQFTDQSSGVPTSHSWSNHLEVVGLMQEGQVHRHQVLQLHLILLVNIQLHLAVTNSLGNDTEVKTNYITVAQATGPCAATSSQCDEYIMQVELNTIDNSSNCSNGGYADYSSQSTSLSKEVHIR